MISVKFRNQIESQPAEFTQLISDQPLRFWNRIAARYAARPLKNVPAYEATLADVASRLKGTDIVLEIGCGTGGTAIRLAPGVAQWTATDFSAEMVKIELMRWMPPPNGIECAKVVSYEPKRGRHPCQRLAYWRLI